jgi:hypothetical protein
MYDFIQSRKSRLGAGLPAEGENEAKAIKWLAMARRPEVQQQMLSRDDLAVLKRRLDQMSVTGVQDFYRTAYLACRVDGDRVPSARSVQELVQAWKQMRKWTVAPVSADWV